MNFGGYGEMQRCLRGCPNNQLDNQHVLGYSNSERWKRGRTGGEGAGYIHQFHFDTINTVEIYTRCTLMYMKNEGELQFTFQLWIFSVSLSAEPELWMG